VGAAVTAAGPVQRITVEAALPVLESAWADKLALLFACACADE